MPTPTKSVQYTGDQALSPSAALAYIEGWLSEALKRTGSLERDDVQRLHDMASASLAGWLVHEARR